jgi:pimeloyl-ACP methyl ester carboxylesterase
MGPSTVRTVRRERVGDVELALAETGRGGRPLLLVHGFTGAKEDFAPLMDRLAADGWHAVAPDLRGHGASDAPDDEAAYGLDVFTADVVALADALGWDRFTLVGHSMGGVVAQRVAVDHPDRLEGLVLMSTFHGPLDIDPALVALGVAIVRQGGMPALASALAAQRQSDPGASAARERIEEHHPGYGDWADAKLLACSPAMWLAMAPRFPAWPDSLADAGRIAVPTLVLVGELDDTMRPDCERLAAAIPGARLEVVEGTRHSPQLEAPERCWVALAGFLDGVAATAR